MIAYKVVYSLRSKLYSYNRYLVSEEENIDSLKKEGLILKYTKNKATKPKNRTMPLVAFKNFQGIHIKRMKS